MGPLGPFFISRNRHRRKPLATAHPEQARNVMTDKSHDPNQMTGAAMIVRALIDHGVQHLFGYPGGAVLPIYDEIFQQSEVEHILVRHEQGAGHAAEGYARSTGKPGVVLVTSGPGATNMVTPLTDALMDLDPAGLHHRAGADASDRQRRVPGMRHRRHHAALHQAQLAGARRQRSGQGAARGVLCRHHRPSRPGAGRRARRTCSSPPAPIIRRASPTCTFPTRRA